MAQAAYELGELAARVGGEVRGDARRRIVGVATLDRAGPEQLSFLTNPRYRAQAETTHAGALLVPPDSGLQGRDLLEVAEPYLALARLLELFQPVPPRKAGVSPQASVGEDVALGDDVAVGPFAVIEDGVELRDGVTVGAGCVIGRDCRIGRLTELRPRVVLYPATEVGERCLIHSGVVLGGDGYGFATSGGVHHKIPQLGHVVVEDDVEIGANTTVDRGTLDRTRIGQGTKIDNLVMVAHGVDLGRGCLLAAQSGIAGSTRVGDHSIFAGQSGVTGHVELAPGTVVAAKSAVLGDVKQPGMISGIPAVEHRVWKRAQAAQRRLPELRTEVRRLRERIAALERRLDGAAEE